MKRKGKAKKIFLGWTVAFILIASVILISSTDESYAIFELNVTGKSSQFTSSSSTSSSSDSSSADSQTFNCSETQKTTKGKEFCGNVPNQNIYCKVKQTTDVKDGQGNVVGTEESQFLAGNPKTTFELTDKPSSKDISEGGFLVTVKIKCASDAQAITNDVFEGNFNPFNQPSVDVPLKIKEGSLLVKVYSKKSGEETETFNANLNYDDLVITDPKEKNLGTLTVSSDRILLYALGGEYDSNQRITVSGDIDLVFRDFDTVNYRLHIDEKSIPTNREVVVIKVEEVKVQEIECATGQVKRENICVFTQVPQKSTNASLLSGFSEISLCIQTFNLGCMLQDSLTPYLVGGLGGLFLIGAIAHNSAPKFDQFGNRIR